MIISHETPIELLDTFADINDYDYALIHLMKNDKYRKYFEEALKSGRMVYLDNSVFELGKAFDVEKFAESAIELQKLSPNNNFVAIAPDVLDNKEKTIRNLFKFKELVPSNMRVMGVLQGSNTDELFECYDEMVEYTDIIGVNHISVAFESFKANHINDFYEKSENRIRFVKALAKRPNASIHLLGILHPNELIELSKLKQVKSADTSNPVCLALEGKSYNEPIHKKPFWSIDDWIKTKNQMNPSQKFQAVLNAMLIKALVN